MAALLELEEVQREIARIRSERTLPPAPAARPPPEWRGGGGSAGVAEHVGRIQSFIESFEYNYSGKPFLSMKKSRGMAHISSVSRQLLREALPIQCVEAVFLGTYLTAGMSSLERIPLSFKTKFVRGTVHRHIVLAVRHAGKWGALGISRRSTLMNKDIVFDTLADLVENYRASYEACYHKLLTVYIGLPFPHDLFVDHQIKWRATKIRVYGMESSSVRAQINSFSSSCQDLAEYFRRQGTLPAE